MIFIITFRKFGDYDNGSLNPSTESCQACHSKNLKDKGRYSEKQFGRGRQTEKIVVAKKKEKKKKLKLKLLLMASSSTNFGGSTPARYYFNVYSPPFSKNIEN